MTLDKFLEVLSQIFLLIVTGSTLFNWARYRDRTRRDIALVFVTLTTSIILQDLQNLLGVDLPWLNKLGTLFVVSHPYFLLKLAQYFSPVRKAVQRAALVGLVISWVVLILSREPASIAAATFVFAYFALVEVYATYIFVRGALTIPGITGKRLRLVSVASGLLAFLFIVAMVLLVFIQLNGGSSPTLESRFTSFLQVFLILSGLAYYLGFSPPRSLRRYWQLNELHLFLDRTSKHLADDRMVTYEELSTAALRTVGGATTVIAVCNANGAQLRIELAGEPPLQVDNLEASSDAISKAWAEQKASIVILPKDIRPQIRRWAEQFNARSLFALPIKSTLRPWGLLIVALRYDPLFPQDDLDLLTLLAEQSAIQLDHTELTHQLQHINQSLEGRVTERTLLLEKSNRDLETQINERRQAEAQIAYQAYLLENVNDAVIGSDQNTIIKFWNSGAQNIFGWNAEEVLGRSGRELMRSEFTSTAREAVLQQLALTGNWKGEAIQYRKDGTPITVEVNSITLHDADGEISGYVSVSRDITSRKHAEEALKESEAKFSVAFRASPLALVITTMDGKFIETNTAFCELTGYSAEQIIGATAVDLELLSHEDRTKLIAALTRDGGSTTNLDVQFKVRDGSLRDILYSIETISLRGAPHRLSAGLDVTQRKRDQEKILRMNDELEKRVTERTAQLEAANKELETFSYSVSHDLRSPLRSIDGYSQILLEDYSELLPAEGRGYLERVRIAAQRMSELIDDLLKLARVSKSAVQLEQVDLSEMVESITSELKQQQPERILAISITPDLEVNADRRLMRIVLENLLNNAWKFTSKKDQAVIEFGRQSKDGKPAFFIRDNGAGFDMAYAEKLFGVFQRLHSVNEFPGTGVGLATVHRILKIHGGEIWAEGKVGEGAAFYFTL